MRKSVLLLLITLSFFASFGQNKAILIFDLVKGTMDSLPIVAYDTTVLNDFTNNFIGNINSDIEPLEQTSPIFNTYPGSAFTYKKQASIDYDLTNYPIRTSVKIFANMNDTLKHHCSGSLISKRHVFTAAHCISVFNSNVLRHNSFEVFPVFDNGVPNSKFNSSSVTKIYFFQDWSSNGEDFAVLELAEEIGAETGWLSIGFSENDSLLEGVFYKFSYPATTLLFLDSNAYNGDTMYYNYGKVDIINSSSIGISGTNGIPGESGSSLIKVVNNKKYISYGVLSFSSNLSHSRISNWQFYALKNIIAKDLVINPKGNDDELISIYPNPATGKVYIKNRSESEIIELSIFDNLGKHVLSPNKMNFDNGVDISSLLSGVYYMKVTTETFTDTKIIIKI